MATIKIKWISSSGKFLGWMTADSMKEMRKFAKADATDEDFFIAYKEVVTNISWSHELLGSWGNPIAYQRYLGVTRL